MQAPGDGLNRTSGIAKYSNIAAELSRKPSTMTGPSVEAGVVRSKLQTSTLVFLHSTSTGNKPTVGVTTDIAKKKSNQKAMNRLKTAGRGGPAATLLASIMSR